jgi:hypothetical protein
VFVQIEIQGSLHFENIVYLGFVSGRIDDARFWFKLFFVSSPDNTDGFSFINLL